MIPDISPANSIKTHGKLFEYFSVLLLSMLGTFVPFCSFPLYGVYCDTRDTEQYTELNTGIIMFVCKSRHFCKHVG